jgi:hypothetical protein
VCDSAADEQQASRDNVCADDAARNTSKQCADECIPEKYVFQQLHLCGQVFVIAE